MVATSDELQIFLEIVGVFVFALSGALVGVRKGLDMVGWPCWLGSRGWAEA